MIPLGARKRSEGKEHAQDGSSTRHKTQALHRGAQRSTDRPGNGGEPADGKEVSVRVGAEAGGAEGPAATGAERGRTAHRGAVGGVGAAAGRQASADLAPSSST